MIQVRLNKIKDRISDKNLLEGKGMGNEKNFHIFDYEPQYELQVRAEVEKIKKNFNIETSDRKIIEIDLYKLLIEIMKEEDIFESAIEMETEEGKSEVLDAVSTFITPERYLQEIKSRISESDVVFVTGVGKVYPFVRSHNILNNALELDNPLIMFYPGRYSGQDLTLFDKIEEQNYYRAFPLIIE